jgi:glycine/D-amino acid oxidase-like deaminating enzyme/nitrite reductase/ring-hydroxylating ferredoxin subunit
MFELDTTPLWLRTATLPRFPALDRDLTVDVAVVGAGITGITTAYLLKCAGVSVALVEREECASIDTGHTSAHLTMVTDTPLTRLVEQHGRDTAMAIWDAGRLAIDRIEAHIEAERIACDFRRVPGFLHAALAGTGMSQDALRDQARLSAELGFAASFVADIRPFGLPGVRFADQALFHPRKYLAGLLRTIPGDGGHVFEHSAVDEVTDNPLSVKANGHTVSCAYVILATQTPLIGKSSLVSATVLQSKLALYTSYVLAGRLPADQIPHGLYWDTMEPYHFLRTEPSQGTDLVVFGGADHKTGQVTNTQNCYQALEKTLRRIAPNVELTDRWSGQVLETIDGLPFVGETADRQFTVTGCAGNGMTFGTLGAMMARDAVLGRPNPWRKLLDPHRNNIRSGAWNYVRENKDYLYYMLRDHLARRHSTSIGHLRPGQGKVVSLNGQRVAAYRDEQGVLALRSAICTHMACEVHWNQAETTWDCPCHGSRFKTDGSVISGPAESPLTAIDED